MIMDRYLKSKAFVEAQLWVFNGFAAVSLAFYFSLFSAGKPDDFPLSLQLSVILFGISLVTNSSLALVILVSDKDAEFFNMLNQSKCFGWVPIIAVYSLFLAVMSLILYYSLLAFVLVFIMAAAIYFFYKKTLSDDLEKIKESIRKSQDEQFRISLELLKMEKNKKKDGDSY